MAVNTYPSNQSTRSALDHPLSLARVNWEVVAYLAILAASVVAHIWGLGRMALHHDESIHAWSSWRFFTGAGGFTCWGGVTAYTYCYDPVYHGPSLYFLTALSYFLFGDGDAQARLPMALAGIAMSASCWWLRPYLGRRGALVAAVLLAFSPSLLYYTRFARHDGLMVLWEILMVIGIFRWLDSGRPAWLYLTTAAIALAVGTHELYYILFFIFGVFVLMRLIAESRFVRYLNLGLLIVIGLCLALMVINPPLPFGQGLYLGEKAFLVASALVLAWLCQRLWDPRPLLTTRLQMLWQHERSVLWTALAIMGGIYVVLYTTFFAYPRGALDGLYAGLAYWLGSQQEYARGDQPWYYYLMQLPLYEPLAVLAGIGTVVAMITGVVQRARVDRKQRVIQEAEQTDAAVLANPDPPESGSAAPASVIHTPWELFPLLLVFWFFMAVIIFSWAGEKMPWLVVHMALPGNLLAAWCVSRLFRTADAYQSSVTTATTMNLHPPDAEPSPAQWQPSIWLVPITTLLTGVAIAVALWQFGQPGTGQGAQSSMLQGLVPLLIAGGLIYGLLTLATHFGGRVIIAIAALTFAGALGAYTLRATWMAVYRHPDTPIELLVYTQTAPDVPRIVGDVRALAINLTRNNRTPEDEAGGLSMPIVLDSGSATGEGSLAWPLQWYLRDFQRLNWTKSETFQTSPGAQTFEVQMPDGTTALAPVVMLYRPHVNTQVRSALEANYVQPYGPVGVFNWWFSEGDKCSPQNPGYKRFYFSTWTPMDTLLGEGSDGCGRDISQEVHGPFASLLAPFRSANWPSLYKFLIYRELPYPLVPGAREMEFWLRKDLAGGFGAGVATSGSSAASLRLVAEQMQPIGAGGGNPTGAAVDAQSNLYITATGTHQVLVYSPDGTLIRTLGGFGNQPGQLYEPRGVAVDAAGHIYVADTWNARIAKYDAEGRLLTTWGSGTQDLADGRRATITEGSRAANEANPLGFFGPRGIAVDADGNVYIADTGNKRIVVTDTEGNYRYQWGYAGAELGAFNEPTGVAVDAQGNVYVADTWNGRVQVFAPDGTGQVSPIPIVTWQVSGWLPNTYDDPSIAASPDGQVYVSVPSRQQVLAANLRGDVLLGWGGAGSDLASLNAPSGIAVMPDGSVWVVDRTSERALRFRLPQVQPGS